MNPRETRAMPPVDTPARLRLAGPDDAESISGLAILVFLSTYAAEGLRPDLAREALTVCSVARFTAALADPQQRLALIESRNHLLAFSQLSLTPTAACEEAPLGHELIRLYVHPAFQRQNLGRQLLADVEAECRTRAQPLWLTAWSGNQRALDFYRDVGFRDIGAKPYVFESQTYENRILLKSFDPGRPE
jgi:ribosomal protein S18 acetylase RimI-like enzyme